MPAPYVARLCPAGHLPHTGGDWQLRLLHSFCNFSDCCNADDWLSRPNTLISPPVGEMSGRTEGGVKELPRHKLKLSVPPKEPQA